MSRTGFEFSFFDAPCHCFSKKNDGGVYSWAMPNYKQRMSPEEGQKILAASKGHSVFGFLVFRLFMPYFLYILQMSNGQLYVGTTANLNQRYQRHLNREASRTTSVLGVEKLVYSEVHPDRVTAEKRERQLKKWSHSKKEALIRGDLKELKRLAKRKKD